MNWTEEENPTPPATPTLPQDLDCPVETEEGVRLVALSAYWGEGVALVSVAALGVLGNTISGVILASRAMRNSFNLLLVALAVYDNTYLVR